MIAIHCVIVDNFMEAQTQTIADRLFDTLRLDIVEGRLKSGAKLSEPELAKQFGVSRGTLRDALGRLEGCNLVYRKPNVGFSVITLSTPHLLEIFRVREALEGMACRLAAYSMNDDEIQQLRSLLSHHQDDKALQDGKAYFQEQGDEDFHYRIVQGSKNSKLIHLLCDDLYYLVRMYRVQLGMSSPRAQRAFHEHESIVNAIEDRDGDLAEMLMRKHIAASRKNVEKNLLKQEEV